MLIGDRDHKSNRERLLEALAELDYAVVEVNGESKKPSDFYSLHPEPPYVEFSPDCPDALKEKIDAMVRMKDEAVKGK